MAGMADTTVQRGRPGDCAADALLGVRRALQVGDNNWRPTPWSCSPSPWRRAAAILAAGEAARHAMGAEPDPDEQAIRGQALKLLDQHSQAFALGYAEGRALDLSAALSLAAEADRNSA